MQHLGGTLGTSKHRTMGKVPKSPKLRHNLMLEARKNERKAPTSLPSQSVTQLFKIQRKNNGRRF